MPQTPIEAITSAVLGNPPDPKLMPSREGVVDSFRILIEDVDKRINDVASSGTGIRVASLAELNAIVDPPPNFPAEIRTTGSNSGYYRKTGLAGEPGWEKVGDFETILEDELDLVRTWAVKPCTVVSFEVVTEGDETFDLLTLAAPVGTDVPNGESNRYEFFVPTDYVNQYPKPRILIQGAAAHYEWKTNQDKIFLGGKMPTGMQIVTNRGGGAFKRWNSWFPSGDTGGGDGDTSDNDNNLGEAIANEALSAARRVVSLQTGRQASPADNPRGFTSALVGAPATRAPLNVGYVTKSTKLGGHVLRINNSDIPVDGLVVALNIDFKPETNKIHKVKARFDRIRTPDNNAAVQLRVRTLDENYEEINDEQVGTNFFPVPENAALRPEIFMGFAGATFPDGAITYNYPAETKVAIAYLLILPGTNNEIDIDYITYPIDVTANIVPGDAGFTALENRVSDIEEQLITTTEFEGRMSALESGRATILMDNIVDHSTALKNLKAAPRIRDDGYYLTDNHVITLGHCTATQAQANTDAINLAYSICKLYKVKVLHFPKGILIVRTPENPTIAWKTIGLVGGIVTNYFRYFHIAIPIDEGEIEFRGHWTTIKAYPPASLIGDNEHNYHCIFGVKKAYTDAPNYLINMTSINLTGIKITGIIFDGDNTYWNPVSARALMVGIWIGVDESEYYDLKVKCSNGNNIRGGQWINCRNLKYQSVFGDTFTQLFHLTYVDGVKVENTHAYKFQEACDVDQFCRGLYMDGLSFKQRWPDVSETEGQCIDLAPVHDAEIKNIRAEKTGSIISIYQKYNSAPTFDEFWFNHTGGIANYENHAVTGPTSTPNRVNHKDVSIRNISGTDCGFTYYRIAILVSLVRDGADVTTPVAKNISFEKVDLVRTGPFLVFEADDFSAKKVRMTHVNATTAQQNGLPQAGFSVAGSLSSGRSRRIGLLKARLEDIVVEGSTRGGIQVDSAYALFARTLRAYNYNLDRQSGIVGVDLRGANRFPSNNWDVDDIDAWSTHAGSTDLRLQPDGNADFGTLALGKNIHMRGAGAKYIRSGVFKMRQESAPLRSFELPVISATTTIDLFTVDNTEDINIERIDLVPAVAYTADASNYLLFRFYRLRAGAAVLIGSSNTTVGLFTSAANAVLQYPYNANDSAALFQAGDKLRCLINKIGTPINLEGAKISVVTFGGRGGGILETTGSDNYQRADFSATENVELRGMDYVVQGAAGAAKIIGKTCHAKSATRTIYTKGTGSKKHYARSRVGEAGARASHYSICRGYDQNNFVGAKYASGQWHIEKYDAGTPGIVASFTAAAPTRDTVVELRVDEGDNASLLIDETQVIAPIAMGMTGNTNFSNATRSGHSVLADEGMLIRDLKTGQW